MHRIISRSVSFILLAYPFENFLDCRSSEVIKAQRRSPIRVKIVKKAYSDKNSDTDLAG